MTTRVLVLQGLGINCEREMARAFRLAGAEPELRTMAQLLDGQVDLAGYGVVAFPGGFSFGDELGAGRVLAHRMSIRTGLREALKHYVSDGGCILGVCNGFQVLVQLGLLPGDGQRVALAKNENGQFVDRWVWHKATAEHCVFTKGVTRMLLPIRHSEGRLVGLSEASAVALRYTDIDGTDADGPEINPNGSPGAVAALCDPTGRILGMMAHPEAAVVPVQDPRFHRTESGQPLADGLQLFRNVVAYAKEKGSRVCQTS